MRISDWSSDVCSSDLADILIHSVNHRGIDFHLSRFNLSLGRAELAPGCRVRPQGRGRDVVTDQAQSLHSRQPVTPKRVPSVIITTLVLSDQVRRRLQRRMRSEEHTSELQSPMRISYAVFCLKKKKKTPNKNTTLQPAKE